MYVQQNHGLTFGLRKVEYLFLETAGTNKAVIVIEYSTVITAGLFVVSLVSCRPRPWPPPTPWLPGQTPDQTTVTAPLFPSLLTLIHSLLF